MKILTIIKPPKQAKWIYAKIAPKMYGIKHKLKANEAK
jgi:hypothetical protein